MSDEDLRELPPHEGFDEAWKDALEKAGKAWHSVGDDRVEIPVTVEYRGENRYLESRRHRPVQREDHAARLRERSGMSDVAKVVTIIGSSPESFAKAADVAVQEAAKTLRGIAGAQVVSMSADVEGDRITMYKTTVNIAFGIERS